MILGTQRREDEMVSNREQLTLELTLVSGQKIAKLIELSRKLRADHPDVQEHVDEEATPQPRPSILRPVLDAIIESQESSQAFPAGSGRTEPVA